MATTSTGISEAKNVDVEAIAEIRAPKRILVDADNPNIEVVSDKKPKVPQENDKKIKVMRFIAFSHQKILAHFFDKDADPRNISLGDQIHNILFTAYTILRQQTNLTDRTLATRIDTTEIQVTYNGRNYTKSREQVLTILEAEAIEQGIPFKKYEQNDVDNWYDIANTFLNFLSGFALRRKELRLGHDTMPIERKDNTQRDINLSEYGIYRVHHVLCEGISFPPEKRAAMPQTLGPMTSLLCLIKAERRYSRKWEEAVKRVFAHFPNIDDIIQLVKEKDPAQIRTLLCLIADVALITATCQACRMFPPPAVFSFLMTKENPLSNMTNTQLLNEFDFSGKGAFLFYKAFCHYEWSLNLNGGTDVMAAQITYHAMMGTFKEDLGILEQITNQVGWYTRDQLGMVFKKSNTEGRAICFLPIKHKYYSKFSQANQSGLLTSFYNSKGSKRKMNDPFFDQVLNDSYKTTGGRSMHNLIATYTNLREELRNYLESKGRVLDVGTTSWYMMDDLSILREGTEQRDLVLHTSGKLFLGRYN